MAQWISRGSLDAIGHGTLLPTNLPSKFQANIVFTAAFDYEFNSLDHGDSELERAYSNLWCVSSVPTTFPNLTRLFSVQVFGSFTKSDILRQVLAPYIPAVVRNSLLAITGNPRVQRLVAASDISTAIAKSLVGIKTDALTHGSGSSDVMTLMRQSFPLFATLRRAQFSRR